MAVTTIALVAVNAADRDTCERFEIGDDGAERMAIIRVAVQCLGMQRELSALGRGDPIPPCRLITMPVKLAVVGGAPQ
jgi:hypothetical protein